MRSPSFFLCRKKAMGHAASFIRPVFVEPSYFLTNGNGHKNKTQTGRFSDLKFVLDMRPPVNQSRFKYLQRFYFQPGWINSPTAKLLDSLFFFSHINSNHVWQTCNRRNGCYYRGMCRFYRGSLWFGYSTAALFQMSHENLLFHPGLPLKAPLRWNKC